MKKIVITAAVLSLLAFGAYWKYFHVSSPTLRFGEDGIDFARLEWTTPLGTAERARLTPRNVAGLTQEQVDQLYARLTAGPIPDAVFDGALFFPRGAKRTRFAEVIGGGMEGGLKGKAAEIGITKLDVLGERLWRGKVFDRETRVLRNRITNLKSLDLLLDKSDEQQLDGLKDARLGQYLLFPAKLYCGQSLLDARRESIIIDYAYTDDLPGYLEELDRLVGRKGLRIRDEIRMVRPGFYLGRAYLDRVFVLDFTLYNKELAEAPAATGAAPAEDCWTGEQAHS
jgi:hypothetical protein